MPVSFDTGISALTTESQVSFRPSPYIINSHLYSSNRKISLSIQAVAYILLTPKHGHLSRYVELYHTLLNLYGIDCPQISPAFRKFSNILLIIFIITAGYFYQSLVLFSHFYESLLTWLIGITAFTPFAPTNKFTAYSAQQRLFPMPQELSV